MPTFSNTPRPAYVYEAATDQWIPVGFGPHTHAVTDVTNAFNTTTVTTKGDLVVAAGSNNITRLAAGNSGEQLVADSSTSTGLRYQEPKTLNSLINGGADIWQRGTSFSSGGGLSVYTADRWHFYRGSNAAGGTLSRQTSGLTGFQYAIRLQRNSGNTSTEQLGLRYTLESADSYRLAGKTVTLSFYLRKGSDYSASGFRATIASGTGTDQPVYAFTGFTYAADTTVTPTTSWVRYSVTGTISSSATEVGLEMFSSCVGTAGTNDYVDITGLQLEIGSVPTPFVRSAGTIQGELAAAQRYYFRQTSNSTNGAAVPIATGIAGSTTALYAVMHYPVTMRATPTSVDFANINTWQGGGLTAISNVVLTSNSVGTDKTLLTCTTTGLTNTQSYGVLTNASGVSGFIGLSAEL
jgi:hypothetical protein